MFSTLSSPFVPFDLFHNLVIFFTAGVCIGIFRFSQADQKSEPRNVRLIIAGLLVLQILSFNLYHIFNQSFNLKFHLPFHLCSISAYLTVLALFLNRPRLNTMQFYLAPVGGLVGLLFPDTMNLQNFPSFRFIEYFSSHCLIIIGTVYILVNSKVVVDFKNFITACLVMLGFLAMAFVANLVFDGNYFNLRFAPNTSFITYLGSNYIYYLIAMGYGSMFIQHLLLKNFWDKKTTSKRLVQQNQT